jgi:hypothetical protein
MVTGERCGDHLPLGLLIVKPIKIRSRHIDTILAHCSPHCTCKGN